VFALLVLSLPAFAVTTKSVSQGLTADQVAQLLTGPGATISNVRITGSPLAIGSFAEADALGLSSGVALSTGDIADAAGPNTSSNSGDQLGTAGHPALDLVVSPFTTNDAAVLEFDVVTVSPTFAIRYVFASEEYREWVDSEFNDVFAFFVNGSNIAITPGSGDPVTINTINHLRNQGLYRDNEGGAGTQFDGYTTPLLAVAVVEPGVSHHIRIAIADTSDFALDSAVLIAQGGISGSQLAPLIVLPVSTIEARLGQTIELPLALYYAFEKTPPHLSGNGVPGATTTFSPIYLSETGRFHYSNMKLTLGPETPPGTHVLQLRSAIGEAESFATLVVIVECQPPGILGTGQPQPALVDRGSTATFRVSTIGSTPQRYQWYRGFPGMTRNPVAGGTGPTLTVPNVNAQTPYWVRVTNPCGTTDSLAAYTIPR
jgi:hypothetical protein